MKKVKNIILITFIIFYSNIYILCKTENKISKLDKEILNTVIYDFEINDLNIFLAVNELVYRRINLVWGGAQIYIGNEKDKKNKIMDKTFSLNIEKATLKEILNKLIELDSNYFWIIDNGVINIFPRDKNEEGKYTEEILSMNIDNFKIKEVFVLEAFKKLKNKIGDKCKWEPDLANKLIETTYTNEEMVERNKIPTKFITLNLKNKTVKEIFNEIIRQDRNSSWFLEGFKKHKNNRNIYNVYIDEIRYINEKGEQEIIIR